MKVKNAKETADIWVGQLIQPAAYYTIQPIELFRWQSDSKVLSDIGNGGLIFNNEIEDIINVATAINTLLKIDIEPRDVGGSIIQKPKVTTPGWVYDQRSLLFETSKLNSVINKKFDGSAWGDATIKFYNAANNELTTQPSIDTDCVKTVIDFEPLFHIDLIGGELHVLSVPVAYDNSAQLWSVAVPDLPAIYGGSVGMVDGRVLRDQIVIKADGRGVKTLYYDPTYHTNKMRTIITHAVGHKIRCEMVFEIFYAR